MMDKNMVGQYIFNLIGFGLIFMILVIPASVLIGTVALFVIFVFVTVIGTVAILFRAMIEMILVILGKEYDHWTESDSPGGEFSVGVRYKLQEAIL